MGTCARAAVERTGGRTGVLSLLAILITLAACGASAHTSLERALGPPRLSLVTYGEDPGAVVRTTRQIGPMLVDVGSDASPRFVSSLHRAAPRTKVITYFAPLVATEASAIPGTCLRSAPGRANGGLSAASLLHTGDGTPITYGRFTFVDFGIPTIVHACVQAMVAQALRQGADGVFLDTVNARLADGLFIGPCPGGSPTCQSQALLQTAYTRFIRAAAAALHAHGLILVTNIGQGDTPCAGSREDCWRTWSRIGDGAMEESFVFGSLGEATRGCAVPAQPQLPSLTLTQIADIRWNEANGKYTLVSSDIPIGDDADLRYALAFMLLVAGPHTSWDASQGCYGDTARAVRNLTGSSTWPKAIQLGAPGAAATVTPDGVLVRQFARGRVAINLSPSSASDGAVGRLAAGGIRIG